jgi:hypothetical protein
MQHWIPQTNLKAQHFTATILQLFGGPRLTAFFAVRIL